MPPCVVSQISTESINKALSGDQHALKLQQMAHLDRLGLAALILLGAASRVWVLVAAGQLSSDEAIPGLMARHIVTHAELPVFYWGQDYFGAAEAYLIAGLFAVFGFWPWLIFVPAFLASLALIPLTWAVAAAIAPRPAGLIAALPLAVAPPVLSGILTNSGGGFSLAFALEWAALLCILRASSALDRGGPCSVARRWVALYSLLTGVAIWIWQPALVALPPLLGVVLIRHRSLRRPTLLVAAAALAGLGLAPALVYNATRNWPTLSALARKSTEAQLPGTDLASQLAAFGSLAWVALGGGDESVGDANPVQAALLVAGLVVVPLAFGVAALRRHTPAFGTRAVSVGLLLLATAPHTAAAYEGARYLVPLVLCAASLTGALLATAGGLVRHGRVAAVVLACVCFGVANLSLYPSAPALLGAPDLAAIGETRLALAALQQRGLRTGYADYWAAYPITYLSAEQIIVAPDLPFFWRARTDRYPVYTDRVDAVTEPSALFALVDQRCSLAPYVAPLDAAGVTFRVEDVARWRLIWDLHAPPGTEATSLAAWRAAIHTQPEC